MPTSVPMPALGESVSEGTVTQWLKQEGDTVEVDEPLLEVSTDKVDTEIPSPVAGVLTKILVGEDETVDVGADIAVIGDSGESPAPAEDTGTVAADETTPAPENDPSESSEPAPEPAASKEPEPEPAPEKPAPEPAKAEQAPEPKEQPREDRTGDSDASVDIETVSGTGRSSGTDALTEGYVSPLVRKLASEQGVDLNRVEGTGVGGRIRKQDVKDAARRQQERPAAPAAAPAAAAAPRSADTAMRGRTEQMSRLRQTIAEQSVESLRTSAQLTQVIEVDVSGIAALREQAAEQFAAREGVELSFFPFFALAAVEALKTHPKLNAVIDSDKHEVTYHSMENLAVAVDTERGMLAPVIKDAGDLNLGGIARKMDDLSERAHTGLLNPDELSGGTFTVTDTGADGALFETPIINQPQVAVLGTGAVVKRPVVVEDSRLGEVIAVRSMAYLALSYDHRLIDGADAARFLQTVRERLDEGAFEAELGLA